MAQVQRIDLLQNNFACATAKFPATYPVFLSGKVTREGHAEWVKQMRRTFGEKDVFCHNEDVHWFHVKEWTEGGTTKGTTKNTTTTGVKGGKGGRKGHAHS